LSFFEFTGYASRIAFLTDGFLRGAGLSGKATFSVLTSCGCAVNGVTSTRIIEDFSERSRAILLSPLMPCGAKLLVMQWIAQNFFARPTLIVLTAYLFTGLVCYGAGALLKKFGVYGQNLCDFVMELPTYRTPTLKAVLFTLWQKIKSFLVKAGTVIVATSIIIWFLSSFNFSLQYGKNNSMLKVFGKGFSVILKPLGFLSEEIGISLLCGVFARESIISVLSVDASAFYSVFSIFGFMLFVNLYPPCVCALGAMKKEFSSNKNFFIAVLIQFLLAYSTAVLVNFIGILFVFNKVLATFLLCFAMLLSLTVILLNNSKIFQKRKEKLNGFNFF
jgi:ferrous iron transport protein B